MIKLMAPQRSNSISILTVLSALSGLLIIAISVASSIQGLDQFEQSRQKETLLHALRQQGYALGRELQVETIWSEGYKNTRELNVAWMGEFYGPYLDRLLGYNKLFVLNQQNQPVYGYAEGVNGDGASYEQQRKTVSDLVDSVRASPPPSHVIETRFELGEGQSVLHRHVADVRSIDGRPSIVVLSTIYPDTPQEDPLPSAPFLMMALRPVDQAMLDKIGDTFGFRNLKWMTGSTDDDLTTLEITGSDSSRIGRLSWTSDHPGLAFGKSLLPGLAVATVLFLALAGALVRRVFFQARSLERYSLDLAGANAKLEERVAARTHQLQATFDNIAQGVVLLDETGKIVIANAQSHDLMETNSEDLLQSEVASVLCELTPSSANEDRRSLGSRIVRRDFVRPSGRQIELRQRKLAEGGCVLTISDVTALKRRQKELEDATQAANAANQAKSRFLSTMSHEMRTPLHGIIGALELVNRTPLTADQRQFVQLAEKAGEALLVHINDVLDFSKLEAEKLELTKEPFDLVRTLRAVKDIIRSQAEHRKNVIELDIEPDVPRHVIGDPTRLRQILLNLVSNAIKFTSSGSITIGAHLVEGDTGTAVIELSVRDTGTGIAPEHLGSLFKEFSMIESEYKRSGGGTGLGLAISKRLTEAMSGSISVKSTLGKGSIFSLTIPFPVAASGVDGPIPTDESAEVERKGLQILLVDDNSTNRLVGSRLLEASGHHVTTASNGREAVVAVAQHLYDVVLMDVSMPEMDGLEATSEIRKLMGPAARVPIIALTANAVIGDREKFLAAGMNDYLSKPFRVRDLQEKLYRTTSQASTSAREQLLASEPTPAAPLINHAELDELASFTSHDSVIEVLVEYLEELKVRRTQLVDAIAARDFESLERVCHAISGASRSVGAAQLAEHAKTLELASRGLGDAIPERVSNELLPLIDATCAAFAAERFAGSEMAAVA